MHIDTYYTQFWAEAVNSFRKGAFEYDNLIDNSQDNRFGLTVLARPSLPVKQAINQMLDQLRLIEPNQYYYPLSDMHVTILSVVSCYNGFTKQSYQPREYTRVIRKAIEGIHPFKIHFQGITASPGCVMVQGYPQGSLNLLRDHLRKAFAETDLEQSFDTRYTIVLAHATVMRFRTRLSDPQRFLEALEQYRHTEFGTTLVNEIEFVFNDWYQRVEKGQVHAVFHLNK